MQLKNWMIYENQYFKYENIDYMYDYNENPEREK